MDALTTCTAAFRTRSSLVDAFERLEREVRHPALDGIRRSLLRNPRVYGTRLARHSVNEALGSEMIALVSALVGDSDRDLADDLSSHSKDEGRHAKIFAALARRLKADGASEKPDGLPGADESGESFDGDVASFIASTHAAEARNLFVLTAYLEVCAELLDVDDRVAVVNALSSIHEDELRHVTYTGAWVSRFLEAGSVTERYLVEALDAFRCRMWWEAGLEADLLAADDDAAAEPYPAQDRRASDTEPPLGSANLAAQAVEAVGHVFHDNHGVQRLLGDRLAMADRSGPNPDSKSPWSTLASISRALAVSDGTAHGTPAMAA